MQQESIYNLIPKEYVPPPKETMYRSAYPNGLLPTASIFNNFTTSRPQLTNSLIFRLILLMVIFDLFQGSHTHKEQPNNLGKPMCKPQNYLVSYKA